MLDKEGWVPYSPLSLNVSKVKWHYGKMTQLADNYTVTEEKVLDKIRGSGLFDIYGGLLSEKQKNILRMYYDEDLGFSEIAERLNITRQAVYDATQQGRGALERYEEHLRLYEKVSAGNPEPQVEERSDTVASNDETRRIVESIQKIAGEDIIYDTLKLRRKIKDLKSALAL